MKTGDTVPVNIEHDVVAQAKIVEIDENARTVTLIVPATKVVMGLKVELDTSTPEPQESGTQTVITGIDRVDSEGNVIDGASTNAPGESAPVGANTENAKPEGQASQTELVSPPVPKPTVEAEAPVDSVE